MTAAAAATGVRSWLAAHSLPWLTPRILRAATLGLFALALAVSSVGLSGSSHVPAPAAAHVAAVR